MTITFSKTDPQSAQSISELAIRSKGHWGYSKEFMHAVKAELSYQAADLTKHVTYSAIQDQQLMGFYQLIQISAKRVELEALFIDPKYLGQGVGAQLFSHAVMVAGGLKYQIMSIQSDPFAAEFYRKQGCVEVGELESLSIVGRMLPLFEYELTKPIIAD